MKILLVGGYGTIGKKVKEHLAQKHEVLTAGRTAGDISVDITKEQSIKELFSKTGKLDAVVCMAGEAKWKSIQELTEEDYYIGIRSKLMGQVNLVRIGQHFINPGGSITLTTGILADDPVMHTTSAAMVNGALHSFVKAASLELQHQLRINVVSSGMVEDAVHKYADYFPGHNPVPMYKMVNAYLKSIEGKVNGQIIRVYE